MKTKDIKNATDLRNDMIEVYKELRTGTLATRDAKEISNAAGKICLSAKLQLEYIQYTKSDTKIPFLES